MSIMSKYNSNNNNEIMANNNISNIILMSIANTIIQY